MRQGGGDVEQVGFDDLGEAVAAMRSRALAIRSEGPARPIRSLRNFEPGDLVNARLELTGPGRIFRKPSAGVDVRGDGSFVPFAGGVTRQELDPTDHDTPFDIVRETLEQETH